MFACQEGGTQKEDLIERLTEKIAELQNSLTEHEVVNLRLEGTFIQT